MPPTVEVTATCRECGATWTEGRWYATDRPVSRFICECGARPPHVLEFAKA